MDAAARQELAAILRQTRDYLGALQEDGATRVDVSLEAAARLAPRPRKTTTTRTAVTPPGGVRAAARPPAAAPVPAREAPRPVAARPSAPAAPSTAAGAPGDPVGAELRRIAAVVARCAKCPLQKERMRTVPGQGNPHPEILFVGEAPGAEEDRQGVPFVGEAGELLAKMIEAMGVRAGRGIHRQYGQVSSAGQS